MKLPLPGAEFSQFLVTAKTATYASKSDQFVVDPILPYSHQLEYTAPPLRYRDIYYGGFHFPGLEVVFHQELPIWAMTYYGGFTPGTQADEAGAMGDVLKAALRNVPLAAPFRGPEIFRQGEFTYTNEMRGDLLQFLGQEFIYREDKKIYHLEYSGGVIE